jgi:replicative DNA helicase
MINTEFERHVLCCILLDSRLIYQAVSLLSDDDFTDYRNVTLFRAMKKIIITEKHDVLDIALLRNAVNFDDSGLYLTSIINSLPTAGNFKLYVEKLRENSARRTLHKYYFSSGEEISKLGQINFKEWLNKKESQFGQILNSYRKDVVKDSFNPKVYTKRMRFLYKQYRENPGNSRGPKTGFRMLDEMVGGLRLLNILAGTTGSGKSSLAVNIALKISIQQSIPVLYINYEMEADDLHRRIVSCLSGVESNKILYGRCTDEQWGKVDNTIDLIEKKDTLHITDNASKNIDDTVALIHYYVQRYKIKVVFIDYIGEVEDDSIAHKEHNEYLTYGRYSQSLKNACSSLGVHCFLVAQLGRQGDNGKPKRSDIQGSWKIIQKADVFMSLYHDEKEGKHKLIIQKQRHGIYPYDLDFVFHGSTHRFEEIGF